MLHVPFGGGLEALRVHYLRGEGLHVVQALVDVYLGLGIEVEPAREEQLFSSSTKIR